MEHQDIGNSRQLIQLHGHLYAGKIYVHLFLQAKITFGYGGVVHLSLMCHSYCCFIKDRSHCVWVQSSHDLAQHICHSVITSFLVFQFEVEPCKGSHPSVTSGIEVRCHHYVSQGIVICLYQEGLIGQVLLEMFCHCPLQCQKFKLSQMVSQRSW